MSKFTHGRYIGPDPDLNDETAILEIVDEATIKAQFDNLSLPMILTHAWPAYPTADWEIDEET